MDVPLPVDLETGTESDVPSPECPPENCSHQKRDGSILMQQNAYPELKAISQARSAPLLGLPGYAYDARGGREITVYVIDTGIDPNHRVRMTNYQQSIRLIRFQEFRHMRGSIRWLFLPGKPRVKGDSNGHGTCVASKVASPTFGVAKSANIVVVKVETVNGGIPMSSGIAAWGLIARDITLRSMQRKAVVSASISGEQSKS